MTACRTGGLLDLPRTADAIHDAHACPRCHTTTHPEPHGGEFCPTCWRVVRSPAITPRLWRSAAERWRMQASAERPAA